MMAGIRDVAALAGVSVATVSRVLTSDARFRVRAETRERVLVAARELDYVPSHAGRSLRTARSSAIAVAVPDVTSAVFAELTAGADEAATAHGLTLVLAKAEQLAAESDGVTRLWGKGRVDGIILQIPDGAPPGLVDSLAAQEIPIVLINSLSDGPLDTIVLDDDAGISLAVEHLVSLGHRSVGFIGGLPASATGMRRRAGFIRALREHGLPVPGESAPAGWLTDHGYGGPDGRTAAAGLLASPSLPTAIVVANLNAALGVLAEIHRSPLRVPDDISLVALHDVWYADALWPPLTTVRMPLRELGASAVGMLLQHRRGEPVHRVVDAPPLLVVRESTSRPGPR